MHGTQEGPAWAEPDPRRRALELTSLLSLTQQLLVAGEVDEIAAALLETVVTTWGLPRAAVVLTPTTGPARLAAGHGLVAGAEVPPVSPGLARVAAAGAPLPLDRGEPLVAALLPPGADAVAVPLQGDGRDWGALVVQVPLVAVGGRRHRLLGALEQCARDAATAMSRLNRLQRLERLSTTDELTTLPNRRGFVAALERELARSARSGEPLSLVLLDLDHFKDVNDTYGHPAGDEALRNAAAALAVACRGLDVPARYGGEEFAVLVPSCGPERARTVAERLRSAISSAPAAVRLTASAGVASYPDNAVDEDSLVEAADIALLAAKRTGRDRTVASTNAPRGAVRTLRRHVEEAAD